MKVFTKGDIVVVAVVLILALTVYFCFTFTVFAGAPKTVEISVDGKPYASYRLEDIRNKKIVQIETEYGYNILEISSDGVKMTDASCPDKTDVKNGKITKANQMIICIPNRVSVKLTGTGAEVDKVTY